jgi:NADPH2:quinone reductase
LKAKTLVHTAAASSLGKMLVRLARRNGIEVIAIVRKESQKRELMEQEGVRHVLLQTDEKWEDQLITLTRDTNCKLVRHLHCHKGYSPPH